MAESPQPVRVDEIDWHSLLPVTRLFGTFWMAMHPPKLLLALAYVMFLCVGGYGMDVMWGPRVYPSEITVYDGMTGAQFDAWRAYQLEAGDIERTGIFAQLMSETRDSFEKLVSSAMDLRFGVGQLIGRRPGHSDTVVGALRHMIITVPGWLLKTHPCYLALFGLMKLALWAVFGGAIARIAALGATRDHAIGIAAALRFLKWRRGFSCLIAPLIPLVLVALVGLLIAVMGWVFFNFIVLDVIGAILFVLALLGGVIIAVILIGLTGGVHLLQPAIAVEGTDAFDAISRAYNYVMGRPWRWLFYTVVSLLYGAVTYSFLFVVIFITLVVTHWFAGAWSDRLDPVFPSPQLATLFEPLGDPESLDGWGKTVHGFLSLWLYLIVGLLPAYAVSYYQCAQTWIYLLLRRAADGIPYEDVDLDAPDDTLTAAAVPDKAEPVPGSNATGH